jgi:hypothetical protein
MKAAPSSWDEFSHGVAFIATAFAAELAAKPRWVLGPVRALRVGALDGRRADMVGLLRVVRPVPPCAILEPIVAKKVPRARCAAGRPPGALRPEVYC